MSTEASGAGGPAPGLGQLRRRGLLMTTGDQRQDRELRNPDFQNFGGTPDAVQRNRELGAYPASKQYFVTLQVRF